MLLLRSQNKHICHCSVRWKVLSAGVGRRGINPRPSTLEKLGSEIINLGGEKGVRSSTWEGKKALSGRGLGSAVRT
jgi:hypothetical protein